MLVIPKRSFLLLIFAVLALCAAIAAIAAPPEEAPEIVPAAIDAVFVPRFFDDNDEAEIILAGVFRDTCHSLAPLTVELDSRARTIFLRVRALRHRMPYCMEMDVPFSRKISLGALAAGEYRISLEDYPQTIDNLSIAPTDNPEPDDFRFAPVAQIWINESTRELTLEGAFRDSCLELREVRLIRESDDILLVLPIVEYFDDGECGVSIAEIPFAQTVSIRGSAGSAPILIYIRTAEGGSIARVARLKR